MNAANAVEDDPRLRSMSLEGSVGRMGVFATGMKADGDGGDGDVERGLWWAGWMKV